MIEVIMYEAMDGSIFETERECRDYENKLIIGDITIDDIEMFDYYGNSITDLVKDFEDAHYINCKTQKGVEFLQKLEELLDEVNCEMPESKIGIFRLNEDAVWISPIDELNVLNENWEFIAPNGIARLVD